MEQMITIHIEKLPEGVYLAISVVECFNIIESNTKDDVLEGDQQHCNTSLKLVNFKVA